MKERNPIYSAIAERSVLGSLIVEPSHIGEVARMLTAESFWENGHQLIYRAIASLWTDCKPVDVVSVTDQLHAAGKIEEIGGYGFMADLITGAGTASNVMHYAETVCENSKRRQMIAIGQRMIEGAYDQTNTVDEILSDSERAIIKTSEDGTSNEVSHLRDATDQWLNEIDDICLRRRNGEWVGGLPTGFADLDRKLGGLKPAELTILAARPSVGKTALALSIAYKIAIREKVPVAFFSLEQREPELMNRLASSFGGVDGVRLRDGTINDTDARNIAAIADEFRTVNFLVIDKFSQSILNIAANARRLRRRNKIGLVVIDYLQLVIPENRKDPRHEQVASMSRRLKGLARELEVPVLCLAQINRQSEARTDGKPRMSDLRESGAIEQDADAILLLHRKADKEKDPIPGTHQSGSQEIQVLIEKNRNGPTGKVTLLYRPSLMRFENLAVEAYA